MTKPVEMRTQTGGLIYDPRSVLDALKNIGWPEPDNGWHPEEHSYSASVWRYRGQSLIFGFSTIHAPMETTLTKVEGFTVGVDYNSVTYNTIEETIEELLKYSPPKRCPSCQL